MIHDTYAEDNGLSVQEALMPDDPRDPAWRELERQAQLMQAPPWEASIKAIAQALQAIKAGKVTLGVPATGLAHVVSSDGKRTYTVTEDGCTCPARLRCWHMVAAELYRLWQGKLALLRPEGRA